MRILIINPNSDPEMTAAIQRAAEAFANQQFEVVTMATPGAPEFIETTEDAANAAPGMMELVRDNEADFDAIVVACHSDPNIDLIKELTAKPVVGIGEASMRLATQLGHSFSVVTTHEESAAPKHAQAQRLGLDEKLASVRAPEGGSMDFENLAVFLAPARAAVEEDGADVLVMGCAGLSGLGKAIQEELQVPVLDGVVSALIIAAGFVGYGVSTHTPAPVA